MKTNLGILNLLETFRIGFFFYLLILKAKKCSIFGQVFYESTDACRTVCMPAFCKHSWDMILVVVGT